MRTKIAKEMAEKMPIDIKEKMNRYSEVLVIIGNYTRFLEKNGYIDSDWRDEPPSPIDEYMVKVWLPNYNKGELKS